MNKITFIHTMFQKRYIVLFLFVYSSLFTAPKSDPHLLDHLLARTKTLQEEPPLESRPKIEEICHLAEQNFAGLKKWLQETNH